MARTLGNQNIDAVALHAPTDLRAQFINSIAPRKPFESIIDFATHRSFCNKKLYPRQRTLLKLIYLETENMTAYDIDVIEEWRSNFSHAKIPYGIQADVWERVDYLKSHGYTHFPHVQAVMGRRASKGTIGGILGAERLAFMLGLDNPQAHFGVEEAKNLFLHVVATNMIQAKQFQFADIRSTVESCKFFEPYISTSKEYYLSLRTNADKRRIAEYEKRKMPIDHEIASLRCLAMSSTSSSGRGSTAFANFFDEFAHMITTTEGPRSSSEVYNAYQPALDQFGKDSLTYVPSSPYTKVGQFYDLYTTGGVLMREYLEKHGMVGVPEIEEDVDPEEEFVHLTANPEMLIVQLPSWALYEDWERSKELGGPRFVRAIQQYDDRLKRLEAANPEKFKVERKAQFAEVEDAYLNPDKVDAMFEPFWGNRRLGPNLTSQIRYGYEMHMDPGLSNANFALCIAHLEDSPVPDEHGFFWPHVVVDFLKAWQPKDFPDHTIDYVQVEQEIEEFIGKFPSMNEATSDRWNSASMIARLKMKFGNRPRIRVAEFTKEENHQRAEYFKSALNLGWVHCYRDNFFGEGQSLLEQELKFLSVDKQNRVVKQDFGPVTTKDMADCLFEVTYRLLHESLDSWQRALLGIPVAKGNRGGDPTGDLYGLEGRRPNAAAARRTLDELKVRGSTRRMGIASSPRYTSGSRRRGRGNKF
jgi:hypothetical protein